MTYGLLDLLNAFVAGGCLITTIWWFQQGNKKWGIIMGSVCGLNIFLALTT